MTRAKRPEDRVTFFPLTLAALGVATLFVFAANLFWQPWFWGPGASTAAAWVLFTIHLLACRRVVNSFDPVVWTPVLMLLFYMGIPVAMNVFGVGSHDPWELGVPPRLDHGYAVALLSIASFMLGTHLAGFRDISGPARKEATDLSILLPSLSLMVGGFAMVLVGFATLGTGFLFGNYGDRGIAFNTGTVDFRLYSTGLLFLQGGIFGMIASHDPRRPLMTWVTLGFALICALILIRSGDRAGLSALMFGSGWVYSQRVRRVPSWLAVGGFTFALLMVPIIGEFRETGDASHHAQQSVRELLGGAFGEMGSAINTFCYTLDGIPSTKPYDWGLSFVVAVVDNIPRIGLSNTEWGSSWSGLASTEHLPNHWLTYYANPIKFELTGPGYAYAMAAEWYFNFGMPGVLLGMIFVGWVTGKVRNRVHSSSLWLAFSALYVGMMMMLVRDSLSGPIRVMAWPLAGLLILRMILPSVRSEHVVSASADADIDV